METPKPKTNYGIELGIDGVIEREGITIFDSGTTQAGRDHPLMRINRLEQIDYDRLDEERRYLQYFIGLMKARRVFTTNEVVSELRSTRHFIPLQANRWRRDVLQRRQKGEYVDYHERLLAKIEAHEDAFYKMLAEAGDCVLEPGNEAYDQVLELIEKIGTTRPDLVEKRSKTQTHSNADESVSALAMYLCIAENSPAAVLTMDTDIARLIGPIAIAISNDKSKYAYLHSFLLRNPIRVFVATEKRYEMFFSSATIDTTRHSIGALRTLEECCDGFSDFLQNRLYKLELMARQRWDAP
ncbi:MAG TPA: hypothetical protein VJC07_00495 [Candidatus Nanoarchaeia archaeon]|nr:hypothetical protein [Candidatus Nanoarchaeia archaeon]